MKVKVQLVQMLAFSVAALAVFAAQAGDFMDTRLSFVLSENNFMAGPGETPINSPGLGIGADKSNTLFFDNYETKFSGFETLGNLVLSKKMPSFFPNLTTEASLVVRLLVKNEKETQIVDSGSFIQLSYDLPRLGDKSNLQLVLFPISGDRLRLGYSYKISWGGSSVFPLNYGMVPAAKLQLNLPWGYGFLGAKTTQVPENVGDTEQMELVTNYGTLGGFGVDLRGFRAEINGGYFTRGTFAHQGVRGEQSSASGVSYQVGYHKGIEIGTSIDFALYRNDPTRESSFFKLETYNTGISYVIKHEGSFLFQTLENPDQYATTVAQPAQAFDVNFAFKWGYSRLYLDALYRTLSFILFDVPSFVSYQDFPKEAKVEAEKFVAVGVDHHFPRLRLTPGLKFGMQWPATYYIDNLNIGGALFPGRRTVVVYDTAMRSVLPASHKAEPITSLKANLKWDLSEMLSVILEVFYSYDNNQTRYTSDTQGMNVVNVKFVDPNILGMNLAAQARF